QRKEELKRELGDEPAPLFHEVRELILRKCNPERQKHVRAIFEQQPFGELERLVTQTLLDVVKRVAHDELENDYWLRMVARLRRRRAGAPGIPSGFLAQRHGDRDGSRVSQAPEVPGPAADASLLLPGVAEPQRPAPFSHAIGRKKRRVGAFARSDRARTDLRIGSCDDPEETAVGTAARLDRPGGRQPSAGAAPADGRPQAHLLAGKDAPKAAAEPVESFPRKHYYVATC